MSNIDSNTGEIVMYQPDETIRLEVRVENETVWLTQQQISDLFLRDRTVINRHINNVFKEGECDKESNVHFLHIPNSDKPVMYYKPRYTPVNYQVSNNLTSSDITSSTNPSLSISASDARLCRLLPTGRKNHDRFLIVDDVVYLFGASLKDAGKKLFAYIKMQETPAAELLNNIR